jgi:hypothetical protein
MQSLQCYDFAAMTALRTTVTCLVLAYMLTLFGYGLVKYPDAPLHPCSSAGYCGKQGQPHGMEQYERFRSWQAAFEWSWPIGMLALYLLNQGKFQRFKSQSTT